MYNFLLYLNLHLTCLQIWELMVVHFLDRPCIIFCLVSFFLGWGLKERRKWENTGKNNELKENENDERKEKENCPKKNPSTKERKKDK